MDLLTEIIHAFEFVLDERTGFCRAEIASASELNEAAAHGSAAELEHLTGKRIRMPFAVDRR